MTMETVLAYAVPAALVWAPVGLLLGAVHSSNAVLIAALAYCTLFGLSEALALRLHAPTSTWQVPAEWVIGKGRVAKTMTWGVLLGPGIVTRNPYAAMWLIPLLLALAGNPLAGLVAGAAVGVAHGTFRALGILDNAIHLGADVHCALLAYFRWRLIDGLVLLFLAGYLFVALL
jgi:hypothetical protein